MNAQANAQKNIVRAETFTSLADMLERVARKVERHNPNHPGLIDAYRAAARLRKNAKSHEDTAKLFSQWAIDSHA